MKKLKTGLLTLLVLLFCLSFGAFAVACGDGDNGDDKDQTTTYYTVTLHYDSAKGTVTKSDPASADGYVKDETVTLTVTANDGYTVEEVKAGDNALTAGTDGKYTFKVAGNTTVSVTFGDDKDRGEPVVLDAALYGTYKDMDGEEADLVVSATGVKWGDKDVFLAAPYTDGDLFYSVTVDGVAYELHVSAADSTISLNTADYSKDVTFLKEGATISYTVTVSKTGEGTAELSSKKDKYNKDETVTLTVTAGEGWFVKDVAVNGESVSLEDNEYTFSVTRDTAIVVTFLAESEIPAEFQGTWQNIEDSADTFTLTAENVTWTGHTVSDVSISVYVDTYGSGAAEGTTVSFTCDDVEDPIDFTLYYGANAVEIMWFSDEGYEDNYYVLGNGLSAADLLTPGSFSEVGGTGKLSVSDTGAVTIDGTAVKIYYTGREYLVSVGGAVFTAEIRNDNYVIVNSLDFMTQFEYVRDTISVTPYAFILGEWTGSDGEKVTFNADGTVTFTGLADVTSIKVINSNEKGTTLLVKTATDIFVTSFDPWVNDSQLTASLLTNNTEFVSVSFSKTVEQVTFGEAWQSGYAYDGAEEYVSLEKFIIDENGLGLVDDYDKFIEDSYVYGVKVSDTEYAVYINYNFYTMTLTDGMITLFDGDETYTYAQCEIVPQDVFTVTLNCGTEGSAMLSDELSSGYNTYTLVKPAEGETYALTIIVTPNPGYKVKSVTVNGTALVDTEGNNRYAYNADGTDITVDIVFEEAELEPLVLEDQTLYGTTWSCPDTDKKLTIDANGGVKFGEDVLELLSVNEWTPTVFQVRCNGKSWTLSIEENAISFYDSMFTEDYYFTKEGGSTSTTYTVTIEYGNDDYTAAMGTATADKTSYNDGDTVTITVTPGSGYALDSITPDGETLTQNADGTYSFTIHADTDVVVTFKQAA